MPSVQRGGGGKHKPPTASVPLNLGFLGYSHLLARIGLGLPIPDKRLDGRMDNFSSDRLKHSFITSLTSWVCLIYEGEYLLVNLLIFIL